MRTLRYLEVHGGKSCSTWLPSLCLGNVGRLSELRNSIELRYRTLSKGRHLSHKGSGGALEMRWCSLASTGRRWEEPVLGEPREDRDRTNPTSRITSAVRIWCQEWQAGRAFLPLLPASKLRFCDLYQHDFTGNKWKKENKVCDALAPSFTKKS